MNFLNSYRYAKNGFVFIVNTTLTSNQSSPVEEFELPLIAGPNTLNAFVDWGDGSPITNVTSIGGASVNHTYVSVGIYRIEITGDLTGWQFDNGGDKDKIINITNWGVFRFDVPSAFNECDNLRITATDKPAQILTLREAFRKCDLLENFDCSRWDTSQCTTMEKMFEQAGINTNNLLNSLDVTNWDVSNVINMAKMLKRTSLSIFDTTNWNTSSKIGY